ncbi:MAG: PorT family protein [Bacteroidales bacterium]|nr:PorT family protein [Bacteroidales bacterium]
MKNDSKYIDELFRKGFASYSQQAPVNAWQRLSDDLGKSGKKQAFVWLRLAAASIVILMAFAAGYFYAVNYSDESPLAEANTPLIHNNLNIVQDERESVIDGKGEKIPFVSTDKDLVAEQSASTINKGMNNELAEEKLPAEILQSDLAMEATIQKWQKNIKSELTRLKSTYFDVQLIDPGITGPGFISQTNLFSELSVVPQPDFTGHEESLFLEDYTYEDMVPSNSQRLKWTIGAQIAPTVSFRDISLNYGDNPTQQMKNEQHLNQSEEALNAYSGGLQVNLAVSDKWGLQSGMYFSRIGQVNNDALDFSQDQSKGNIAYSINTSAGAVDFDFNAIAAGPDNTDKPLDSLATSGLAMVKVTQNFDLFEIPFLVNYKIINRKFSLNVAGGLSPAYLVDNNTRIELNSETYDVGRADNLNDFIFNSTIGVGIGYEFIRKLTLSVEPTFKYSLSPINKNSEFDYHPYYMSWFTGLKYTF